LSKFSIVIGRLFEALAAKKGDKVGVMNKGTNTKTIQPMINRNRIPSPNLGRKEPDVRQASLVAGISGKSCFHLGFRVITEAPGTSTVILELYRGGFESSRSTSLI